MFTEFSKSIRHELRTREYFDIFISYELDTEEGTILCYSALYKAFERWAENYDLMDVDNQLILRLCIKRFNGEYKSGYPKIFGWKLKTPELIHLNEMALRDEGSILTKLVDSTLSGKSALGLPITPDYPSRCHYRLLSGHKMPLPLAPIEVNQ